MNELYPMKFTPVFKDKIWGGNKIKTKLGLDYGNLPNCGEAWMLSGVKNDETLVANGFLEGNSINDLVEVYMGDLVGDKVYEEYGDEFPLLVKFLDANDWLSIQVHPDDELARKLKLGKRGKTEMWYILEAEKDSELITGFKRKISREEYLDYFNRKKLPEILNDEKVNKGDVFYIPAGRVHSLGPGILLAEIQQTSDATLRIYDWDRIDAAGLQRELHTDMALKAIDFEFYNDYKTHYETGLNKTVPLIESPFFTTNLLEFNKPVIKNFEELDSFVIYMCVDGKVVLSSDKGKTELSKGEVVLIPNLIEEVNLEPLQKSKLLEIYIV
jgi:mannose-6-phosphate isomerase